jgi:hypothetical protein
MDHIRVLEFDDSDRITLNDLRGYMWYRKYFWVARFTMEYDIYGPKVFRSIPDRLRTALKLYEENKLTYSLNRYNCEYYVRRCVFNDPKLWESSQTKLITRDRIALYTKIGTMVVFNALGRFAETKEFEREFLKDEIPFLIDKRGWVKLRQKI